MVRVRQPLNSPTGSQIGISNGNGGDKLANGQHSPTSPTKVDPTKVDDRETCELGTKAGLKDEREGIEV